MDMSGMVITARSGALTLASGDMLFDFRENLDKQTVANTSGRAHKKEKVCPVPQLLHKNTIKTVLLM